MADACRFGPENRAKAGGHEQKRRSVRACLDHLGRLADNGVLLVDAVGVPGRGPYGARGATAGMATRVADLSDIEDRVGSMLDRLGELRACRRLRSDAVISQPFMRDHTAFDSFAEFVERSPWSLADHGAIRDVSRDALDDYVESTTDFGSWEEMETRAAEEALVEQYLF